MAKVTGKKKNEAATPATPASKELAPIKAQEKALEKPAGSKIMGKGFENLEREDILLPRLKLLQQVSPEVTEQDKEAGTIFVNLSNRELGKEVIITPILHFRSRIKWIPKDDGGGIDCSAPDAKTPKDTKYAKNCAACPHKEWDNEAKKKKDMAPKCELFDNFVVFLGDESEPVILSMNKTKLKVAKRFYSSMALKGGDMFSWQYKLGVVKEKGEEATFWNYAVTDIGKKTSEERREQCNGIWEALSKANITVADEAKQQDEEVGATAGAGAGGTGKY